MIAPPHFSFGGFGESKESATFELLLGATFAVDLRHTLIPAVDAGSGITYTRGVGGTVTDENDLVWVVGNNEAPHDGARRAENILVGDPNDLTSNWTAGNSATIDSANSATFPSSTSYIENDFTPTSGRDYIFTFTTAPHPTVSQASVFSVSIGGANHGLLVYSQGLESFWLLVTNSTTAKPRIAGNSIVNPSGLKITNIAVFDVTGKHQQIPPEYVEDYVYYAKSARPVVNSINTNRTNGGDKQIQPHVLKGLGIWESRTNYFDTDQPGVQTSPDFTTGQELTLSVKGGTTFLTVNGTGTFANQDVFSEGNPVTITCAGDGNFDLLATNDAGQDNEGNYTIQCEEGPSATPFIPASGSPVTRPQADVNADIANYTETGWFLIEFDVTDAVIADHGSYPSLLTIQPDTAASQYFEPYIGTGSKLHVSAAYTTSEQGPEHDITAGRHRVCYTWDKDSGVLRSSLDGGTVETDAGIDSGSFIPVGTATKFIIGGYDSTGIKGHWNEHIQEIQKGDTLLPDAKLIEYSTRRA